jgi:hypothetical protein
MPLLTKITPLMCVFGMLHLVGCASLSEKQNSQLDRWEDDGIMVKSKSPTLATVLGFLPGGASFYTGSVAAGIVNALTWPLSTLWEPASGYRRARVQNWESTQDLLDRNERVRKRAFAKLDQMRRRQQITEAQYAKIIQGLKLVPLERFDSSQTVVATVDSLYQQSATRPPGEPQQQRSPASIK